MKNYALDFSCIDSSSSGAKQRIISIYTPIIKNNKNYKFTIIYNDFSDIKEKFKFKNIIFKKNPFNQKNYFLKILSVLYVYFYLQYNNKHFDVIEHFTIPFIRVKYSLNVVTVHDLRKIYFAKFFLYNYLFKLIYRISLNSVDRIVVVSYSIKNELQKYFPNKKIIVSYNVISEKYFHKIEHKELLRIKKKYSLPKKFIISVGHLEKRKNFVNLIKAIKILKIKKINLKLIIIGQKTNQSDLIYKEIINLNLNSNIKIFNNLNDFELRCFYKLADVFIYPSFYEGFGIPILESMASKLPIILSDTAVFREITINKSYYFDPVDPLSIANKIRLVFSSYKIKKELVNFGYKRVKFFNGHIQSKKILKNL